MPTASNHNLHSNKTPCWAFFIAVENCIKYVIINFMKQLSDNDILDMIGAEYTPDNIATKRAVRSELHLSKRIPAPEQQTPEHITLDLHNKTIEQAWSEIMSVATSNARSANIITGASGVLHKLFPTWAQESILSPHIIEFHPINNGSFFVRFHRKK